jgi:hypothetical protein
MKPNSWVRGEGVRLFRGAGAGLAEDRNYSVAALGMAANRLAWVGKRPAEGRSVRWETLTDGRSG